ncbi:lipocalin family protein [Saccharothrix mutabilis subsp. mutabilis]|uniref:Lipocalin family protein n=1 Tax=Saccharothrix mutabilis subsp. mutabilis TaxID=66855 RepID=A0ABN0UEJ3_9PSEU
MRPRTIVSVLATALVATLGLTPPAGAATGEVRPVRSVDLTRYQGTWLQLAAIPQPFQAACARDDRAEYTLLPDGLVRVVNSCRRADGQEVRLEGRARPADAGTTSRLEVTFVNVGGAWVFDDPGTYWVIGLDRDYRWAVVGAPDRRSGFVLSRTARPTPDQVAGIATALIRNGYDLCRFRVTVQEGGAPAPVDLCGPSRVAATTGRG